MRGGETEEEGGKGRGWLRGRGVVCNGWIWDPLECVDSILRWKHSVLRQHGK